MSLEWKIGILSDILAILGTHATVTYVIIHITTQYNISCLIIYVRRSNLHLGSVPNSKVFLNTFQFTTHLQNVVGFYFMHEQSNSEIEIKLKIPPLNLHIICYYMAVFECPLLPANIKKEKHKVTSRKICKVRSAQL